MLSDDESENLYFAGIDGGFSTIHRIFFRLLYFCYQKYQKYLGEPKLALQLSNFFSVFVTLKQLLPKNLFLFFYFFRIY